MGRAHIPRWGVISGPPRVRRGHLEIPVRFSEDTDRPYVVTIKLSLVSRLIKSISAVVQRARGDLERLEQIEADFAEALSDDWIRPAASDVQHSSTPSP